MLSALEEFSQILRAGGVSVAPQALIDAANAVELVGLASSQSLRSTLALTLLSGREQRPTFNRLFDLYFGRRSAASDKLDPSQRLDAIDALRLAELSPLARNLVAPDAEEIEALVQKAARELPWDEMASALQRGFFARRLLSTLDLQGARNEALRFTGDLGGRGLRTGDIESASRQVEEAARRLVAQRVALRKEEWKRLQAGELMATTPLVKLRPDEVALMRQELRRLSRVLRAKLALRSSTRAERLDIGKTLRASVATELVPFSLRHRQRKPRRPHLVVLYDVSDSVRRVSTFVLELLVALHGEFRSIRSFAFVAELGETTEILRSCNLERLAEAGPKLPINLFANSNYGQALDEFCSRHLSSVHRRTEVLIIGDGRNNYHPSRTENLEAIAQRAGRVHWLTPESEVSWSFGDCDLPRYRAYCDRVWVVQSMLGIRRFVEGLLELG